MSKQTSVDDLWPGDVVYYLGEEHRVARVEDRDGHACVTFVTPRGLGEYGAHFFWDSQLLVVGRARHPA